MVSPRGSTPPQLKVNLAVVWAHYDNAARSHFRSRVRAAQFAAIRDIPILVDEIERLFDLLAESLIRYADLRHAAVATIAATEVGEIDPLFYLRLAVSADRRRRENGDHQ